MGEEEEEEEEEVEGLVLAVEQTWVLGGEDVDAEGGLPDVGKGKSRGPFRKDGDCGYFTTFFCNKLTIYDNLISKSTSCSFFYAREGSKSVQFILEKDLIFLQPTNVSHCACMGT